MLNNCHKIIFYNNFEFTVVSNKLLAAEKQKNKNLSSENVKAKMKLENMEIVLHSRNESLSEISAQLTATLGLFLN